MIKLGLTARSQQEQCSRFNENELASTFSFTATDGRVRHTGLRVLLVPINHAFGETILKSSSHAQHYRHTFAHMVLRVQYFERKQLPIPKEKKSRLFNTKKLCF